MNDSTEVDDEDQRDSEYYYSYQMDDTLPLDDLFATEDDREQSVLVHPDDIFDLLPRAGINVDFLNDDLKSIQHALNEHYHITTPTSRATTLVSCPIDELIINRRKTKKRIAAGRTARKDKYRRC